jgi:hypothetical protein
VKKSTILVLVVLLVLGVGCGNSGSHDPGMGGDNPTTETVSYKLAVVDGDASEGAAFQDAIDCILASGIKGAETEEKVGDTLYASWQESSQETSLLDWAQVFC